MDLGQVRKGQVTEHGSIIAMDPPAHRRMRSLLNKVFTPRDRGAPRPGRTARRQHLAAVDPAGFDFVQDFSALFPVDVMTTMQGVPDEDHQQIRLWIDHFLSRAPGEVDMSEAGLKSAIDMAIYYHKLIKERRKNPGDDLLSKLIDAEIERDNGEMAPLDNVEITEFAQLLGGCRAETVTKLLGSAAVVFARFPTSGRSCSTTAARSRPPSRSCCATKRRPSTTCAGRCGTSRCTASPSRRAIRFPGGRFGQPGPRRLGRSGRFRRRPGPHPGPESGAGLWDPQLPGSALARDGE